MSNLIDAILGRGDAPINALKDFKPIGIDAGGFKFGLSGNTITGGSTAERLGLVTSLSDVFKQKRGELAGLRPQVAPGFGRLTEAGMQTFGSARERLEARRLRSVGNLRDNLAQRRVLGSSFATSALASADAEFEQAEKELTAQEAQFKATSFLQELDLTRQLIGEEFNAAQASIQVFLDNLNIEASIATQLASGATSALSANAQLQAKLLQEQINNTQSFLTDLLGFGVGAGGNPFSMTPTSSTTFTPA